jgi:hypothetical protein
MKVFLLCIFLAVASGQTGLLGLSTSLVGPTAVVYSIHSSTGAATPIVAVTGNNGVLLTGIAYLRGQLYATDVSVSGLGIAMGTINLNTGLFTPLINQDGSSDWLGMAADQAANLLYTIDVDVVTFPLKSITPMVHTHTHTLTHTHKHTNTQTHTHTRTHTHTHVHF